MPQEINHTAAIWQGYHHAWEYNHRVNRFGSYVEQGHASPATVVHTAASGTGGDTAHFCEFVTEIAAGQEIGFQGGSGETVVECQRTDLTPFVIRIDDLELAPALQARRKYTIVLNGFDLYALEHSEKIVTFDLDVTEPTIYDGGRKARFYIVGHLRFDCRSAECQLLPIRIESEAVERRRGKKKKQENPPPAPPPPPHHKRGLDRRKFERAVNWFKRQLVQWMGVDEIKQSVLEESGDTLRRRLFRFFGRRYYLRFLKWRISAPYLVRVHFLLIGGDTDALTTREVEYEHTYEWDLEHEIDPQDIGTLDIEVQAENTNAYDVNTLAFRHLSMDIALDEKQGTEDPIQWGRGMHLLEWNMAIREIATGAEHIQAKLDLFYKNWSEAMNRVITFTTWGAVRGAGRARIGARLALLQLKGARAKRQREMPGHIYWPGKGRNAREDPRARSERPVED
jgi:hypothetical protein